MKTSSCASSANSGSMRDGQRQIGHRTALVDRHLVRDTDEPCAPGSAPRLRRPPWSTAALRGEAERRRAHATSAHPTRRHRPLCRSDPARVALSSRVRTNGKAAPRNTGISVRPDDLEQAQCVRHFFVAPLVPAHDGDAQHVHLRRLNQHQQRLHVAAAGSGAVFVDDDLAARWAGRRELASR